MLLPHLPHWLSRRERSTTVSDPLAAKPPTPTPAAPPVLPVGAVLPNPADPAQVAAMSAGDPLAASPPAPQAPPTPPVTAPPVVPAAVDATPVTAVPAPLPAAPAPTVVPDVAGGDVAAPVAPVAAPAPPVAPVAPVTPVAAEDVPDEVNDEANALSRTEFLLNAFNQFVTDFRSRVDTIEKTVTDRLDAVEAAVAKIEAGGTTGAQAEALSLIREIADKL